MVDKLLLRQITLLSLPVLFSNLLQTMITVIDTIMVGRLGPIEIAAIGLGNTVRFLLFVTVMSVAGGAMSLIAQAKGSRNPERMSVVTRQSILSGFILSIILGSLGFYFAEPLVRFMESGNDETAISIAVEYLQVTFLCSPFLLLNFIQNRLMQGAGDTFTPLMITIVLIVLNVIFNYVFIFGWGFIPSFGVTGAAIGTGLSRAIMMIVGLWLFYSGKNVVKIIKDEFGWRPNWQIIKDILNIGVPSGIQGFFRHVANVIVIKLVTATSLGTLGAAAFAIGIQVEQFVMQPVLGINVAGTSLIGQAIGRWQTKLAYYKGNIMIGLGVIVMIIFITPVLLFPQSVIRIFEPSANATIIESATSFFYFNMAIMPFYAVALVVTGAMRGAGDTKPAMISSIIGRNFLTILCAWYFAFPLGMDYKGVWIGMVIGKCFDFIYMSIFWYRRGWFYEALKKTELYRTHLTEFSKEKLIQFTKEVRGPRMAEKGTVEIVNQTGVLYQSGDIKHQYQFSKNDYSKVL